MKIKVSINSDASHCSTNEHIIDIDELGYTEKQWEKLTEDKKYKAVKGYWDENGLPEIWWHDEDAEDEEAEA